MKLRIVLLTILTVSFFGALAQPVFTIVSAKNSCAGADNGSFSITINSGVDPVTILVLGPPNFSRTSSVGSTESFTGLKPNNYIIIAQDANGNSVQFQSITNVAPGITFSSSPTVVNNSNCATPDGSITIFPTGGSGSYSFSWTGPGAFSANTQNLTGLSGGSYSVSITDNNANCTASAGPIIVTDPSPTVFTTSTSTPSICLGSSGTVNLSNSESAAVTYEIYKGGSPTGITLPGTNAALSFTIPAGQLTPAGTYNFTIRGVNGSCTPVFMSGTASIQVNPLPATSSITGTTPVCENTNGISYSVTNTAGSTYVWTITGGTQASGTNTNSITVNWGAAGAGNVSVVETNSFGCVGTAVNFPVTINGAPTTSNAGSPQTICETGSATLAANTPTVGTGAWSITSGPSTSLAQLSSTTSATATFTPAGGPGSYVLRWTISNSPCTASFSNVTITVTGAPTTASAGPDQTGSSTCGLTTVTLAGNTPTSGTGAWSIVSGTGGSFANASIATTTFTGTAGGSYTLRWTISSAPCPASTDDVNITFNQNPTTSNAGGPQTICETGTATLAANTPTVGTGAWSITSGPSTSLAQLSSTTSATATFTPAGGPGSYVLRWTISNSPCTASFSNVTITVTGAPTTASAGPDQTGSSTCGLTTVTLAGNTPTSGTGAWSIVSGTGGSFANASIATTTFTGTAGGSYTLRWTISSAPCPASTDDVNITFNQNPTTSNAGSPQTICETGSTTLAANTPTVGTGAWTVTSGPDTSTSQFSSTTSTTATFTPAGGPGSYVLTWTISNSPCTASSSNVTITVNPGPTTATAGPDQTGSSTCGFTTVVLGGNTPVNGTGLWTIVSGTGGSFANASLSTTTFTGVAGNSYTLRWTISSAPCTPSFDDVDITFNRNPSTAIAGPNQTICSSGSASLSANNPTVGTGSWSVTSGPDTSPTQFSSTSDRLATFTPAGGSGNYVLAWTVSNAPCTSSVSSLTITVNGVPTVSNAGSDQAICSTGAATLAANTPTSGTGAWTVASGPSTSTSQFSSTTNPLATFTPSGGAGSYVLTWTISSAPCTASSSNVTITVNNAPTTSVAGSDQTICANGAATLAANTPTSGTGAWTVASGPDTSTGQFSSTTSPTATFTPAGGPGSYVLTWTISNSPCTASTSNVTITVNPAPTTSTAGPDQTICSTGTATLAANTPVVGTGAWTVASGPSTSTAQFSSTTNPLATFTPAGGAGSYVLTWTISSAPCAASTDNVTITVNAPPTASVAGSDQTICANGAATLAANTPTSGTGAWTVTSGPDTSTGQFSSTTSATATFTPAGGAGSYVLTWTISNSPCSASASNVTITVNPAPTTANAGSDQTGFATCGLTSVTLGANTPTIGTGLWSIMSGTGGSFVDATDPLTTFSGTAGNAYTLRWTISSAPCTASTDDVNITFNQNPTVSNAGGPQTICSNGAATLAANSPVVGTGAWSITSGPSTSTAQFSNTASPTATFTPAGGAGNYVLTWTISNGPCTPSASNVTISVNPSPVTSSITGTSPVCAGTTGVTYSVTNTAGSTYAWTIALGTQASGTNTNSITVDWGAVGGAGSVKVIETNSFGCAGAQVTLPVTINALPTASLTGTTTICSGSSTNLSVSFTGATPWTFKYSDGTTTSSNIVSNFSTFTIPVNPTATTTYSLVSVSDANCTGTISGTSATVTVDTPPTITMAVTAAVTPLCSGASTTIDVSNSETGVSYQLRNGTTNVGAAVAGNGATLSLPTGALAVTTTFNVLATRGVCTPVQLNNTATVTVAGSINVGLLVAPQTITICSGNPIFISVAASEVGVNYQLRNSAGNVNVGAAVAGTGGTINLPAGIVSVNSIFNILASSGTCSAQLTNTATVNVDINPNPNLTLGSTLDPVCSGGSSAVTVAASEVGVSYQLRNNVGNIAIGAAVAGTGGTINLPTGNLAATTTFNVLATGGTACTPVQLTGTITITVTGSINASLTVSAQASPICSGNSSNIQVAASEVGVNYQLRDNSNNSNVGAVVAGTGATINLPTGNLTSAKTFNVLASNGSCSIQLTSTATVNVDINPNISLVTAATINPVCSGAGTSITVAASEVGVSYQLRNSSNVNVGSAVAGTGGTISLPTGNLAASEIFNVFASSGVCTSVQLTNTVSVTVGGSLNTSLTVTAQSASICSGTATNIQVANSEVGVNYQLRNDLDDSAIGSAVAGTGATINLPTGNLSASTSFNVLGTGGTCSAELTTVVSVTVNAQPNSGLSVSAQSAAVCPNTGTNIQVASSQSGVSYQLRDNSDNSLVGGAVVGNGGSINLPTGNLTAGKTFNVLATGGGSCSVQLTSTTSVNVLAPTDPLCTSGGGTGTCATVVITPVPSPAQCTLSNGKVQFNITPSTPAVNNTGVKITITGISSTNLSIARTNFNDPNFLNLPMGSYSYSIEYGDPSCIKTGQVTVDQSGTVGTPTASNPINTTCFGGATGSVTLDVPGETGNLLEWSLDAITWKTFTAGNQINGIPAGTGPSSQRVLSVRRNSSDPCFAAVTVTIGQPADLALATVVTNATCSNNDGSIQITPSGGTGPYTYKLDGTAITLPTNSTFSGLSGGNHVITVIDANSCSKDFTVPVTFPGFVNYSSLPINPDCSGSGSNGVILLTITSSGTFTAGITLDPINPPASFVNVVSTGVGSTSFASLKKGDYKVWVQSTGSQCPSISTVTIGSGPDQVDFNLTTSNILCFEDKGGITLNSITGSALVNYGYEILQNGTVVKTGSITPVQTLSPVNISGIDKGDYQVRLTQDQSVASGCTAPISSTYKNFTITGPEKKLDTLYVNRTISYPDIASGSMLIGIEESKEEPYEVSLELKTPLFPGQAFLLDWTEAKRNVQNLKTEYEIKNLFAGDYILSLRDALGCVKTYPVSIKPDINISIPNIFTPNGDGVNDSFFIRNLPLESKLTITNRWGKEVFSSKDYKNDWIAPEVADGIYFYRLTTTEESYSGWVEIVRGR